MQSIEYDLNITGGLMPQINALTAPPTSDESNKRRKLKKSISRSNQLTNDSNNNSNHPNSRHILSRQTKTGKTPNHEYCDSCREGGDLLCCDRCPNAFHLQCHDPPLDEEDVPQGEWLCRKCKIILKEEGMENESEDEESDEYEAIESDPKGIRKPFSLLIRAAQTLNPKQFQLPNDMMPSIPLIGTSKRINNNKNSVKKQIHELDNNSLVSFPIKLCYQCSKSCRKAPLIQCDYCPLLFHADCLDPPLTCLPTGRWMCPNHSQHVVEQKLLDSVSLSQRIKLWNHFSSNISQDTVKLDFLKKVHRKNPPFRTKIELPPIPRVVVPEAIKDMYKSRPFLLPNINQLSHSLTSSSYDVSSNKLENDSKNSHKRPTPEQQEEWLSNLIAFQSSVTQYISASKTTDLKSKSSLENSSLAFTSNKNTEIASKDDIPLKLNSQINGPTNHSEVNLKKDSNSDKEMTPQMTDNIKPFNGEKGSPSLMSPVSEKRISIQNNSLMTNIETIGDINRLDESLIRLLAFQRIQQLNSKTIENNVASNGSQTTNTIQSFPTTIRRIGLNDVRARAVLCPILIKSSTGCSSGPYIVMSYRTLTIGTSSDNDVVLGQYGHCNYVSAKHATIFFDESSHNYELINYSEHGTTVDNVLYSCDFSDKKINWKHSNTNSQTLSTLKTVANKRKRKSMQEKKAKNSIPSEPLNSEKTKPKKRKSLKNEEMETNAQQINELKTNKITFRWNEESENLEEVPIPPQNMTTMSSKSGQMHKPCACKSSCSSLIGANGAGWEGTAVLHHGSHLKIGCHQFIFSITNHGITQNQNHSNPPKSPIKAEPSNPPLNTK